MGMCVAEDLLDACEERLSEQAGGRWRDGALACVRRLADALDALDEADLRQGAALAWIAQQVEAEPLRGLVTEDPMRAMAIVISGAARRFPTVSGAAIGTAAAQRVVEATMAHTLRQAAAMRMH